MITTCLEVRFSTESGGERSQVWLCDGSLADRSMLDV